MTSGPRRAASSRNATWVRSIARRTSASSSAADRPDGIASRASAIMPDATSPAAWPPAPSATAQRPISGRSTYASSLCERLAPGWVTAQDRKRGAVMTVTPMWSPPEVPVHYIGSRAGRIRTQHCRVGRRVRQAAEYQLPRPDARRTIAPPDAIEQFRDVVRQIRPAKRIGDLLRRGIPFEGGASSSLAMIEPGIRAAHCRGGEPVGSECGEGERKIAACLVNAGEHQAQGGRFAAHARRQGEAPDRRLQEGGQPGVAHQRPAAGNHGLQPAIPPVGEVTRQADAHEIAARRQLAIEAHRRGGGRRCGAQRPGHRKSRSTPGAKGFSTEPARISNEAWRSPSVKLRV